MSSKAEKSSPRVAVIGGGVSGLACAWHLHKNTGYRVELFEAADKVGGHADTVHIDQHNLDVDIGFMVYNDENYPNMSEWFRHLEVAEELSNMSLSVSLDDGSMEWASTGSIPMKLGFVSCLRDMLRFHRQAPDLLRLQADDPRAQVTIGDYLKQNRYSTAFSHYYLYPMTAALWSASMEDVLNFPATQLVSFMANHQMLQVFDRPQWKTVAGRSQKYTQAVAKSLEGHVHVSTPVTSVRRRGSTWQVTTGDKAEEFDHVVFCCHPPTAAQLLAGNSQEMAAATKHLENIAYADNLIYVHSDVSLMPKKKSAWASWNCIGQTKYMPGESAEAGRGRMMEGAESGFGSIIEDTTTSDRMKAVYVTYWLNQLQNLDSEDDFFVSLNPHHKPKPGSIHHTTTLSHPQFTNATLRAREALQMLQGTNGMWFAGAWMGYGFHEDGCRSGFDVATKMTGVALPWVKAQKQLIVPPPNLVGPKSYGIVGTIYRSLTFDLPVAVCKRLAFHFMRQAVKCGTLRLLLNDGSTVIFGNGQSCGCDSSPVTLRIFDDWFFVKLATEYDLGLARAYMAGQFVVERLASTADYHPVIRPKNAAEETTLSIGDPVGLTRLFLLLIGNRDGSEHVPKTSHRGHWYSNALMNASGLFLAKIGSFANFMWYKITMDNTKGGGSLKNIHAHYDISNDLFRTFLDKETLMYSSAIYDAIPSPDRSGLRFKGTLEQAQWRKLDTLLDRAQIHPGQTLLDIGFGWGGLSLHAAQKYGCRVTGITLSVEQKKLADKRVKDAGLESLITFEVVDYRIFCARKENLGKFDRVLSCEMIEAVGHSHLQEFFWAVEQVLNRSGVLVMEAITTPEERYETYLRSTDFINTVIFPGSCCPSLHALVDAAYKGSTLTLEHVDNIGLHYAQTLADWRRRFNSEELFVRNLGFDDIFLRAWNYYLTYCEAGFFSQTENCLILVFTRPGCSSLVPLSETRAVVQAPPITAEEATNWTKDT